MNKQRNRKRLLSSLLCLSLVLSGLTVPAGKVQAEEVQTETTKMFFGTSMITDPTAPTSDSDAWKGNYVYYGNYDADGDGTAESVKYRVLDASTTDYSADGTTKTMLLDCDSILYYQQFDEDGNANETDKNANDWSVSDVKTSLNGDDFLNKDGVFTAAEKKCHCKKYKGESCINNRQ